MLLAPFNWFKNSSLLFSFVVSIVSTGGASIVCFLVTGVTGVAVFPFAKGILKV